MRVASDGTVVYHSSDGGADAAVQTRADGTVRIQTITPNADGPHDFTYAFGEGVTPVLAEDGSVELVARPEDSPVGQIVGLIEQPWAVDATGRALETHYEVQGNELRQVVQADESVTYPVVADPRIGAGIGLHLYLNVLESGTFVGMAKTITALGGGLACAVYAKRVSAVPGAKVAVDKLCGLVSPAALYAFFKTLPSKLGPGYPCTEVPGTAARLQSSP